MSLNLNRVRCDKHHVLQGVCFDDNGDAIHCNQYYVSGGIQVHTPKNDTGVNQYVQNLTEGLESFVTEVGKWEKIILGKKIGGFVSQFPLAFMYPKKGAVMHSSCNWSLSREADSVMIHDLNPLILPGWEVARVMFKLQKRMLREKVVFVPSESTKSAVMYWLNCDPDHITVAHHGINTTLFHPYEGHSRQCLVFTGQIRPYKRVERGILLAKKLGLGFARVGPPAQTAYEKSVVELGIRELGSGFKDWGYVPKEYLPFIYSAAMAVWAGAKWEGFNLPTLEAAACGTPSILADTPVSRELHGDLGIYKVDSLKDLVRDERELVGNARRFTWEKSQQRHLERWKSEGLL